MVHAVGEFKVLGITDDGELRVIQMKDNEDVIVMTRGAEKWEVAHEFSKDNPVAKVLVYYCRHLWMSEDVEAKAALPPCQENRQFNTLTYWGDAK